MFLNEHFFDIIKIGDSMAETGKSTAKYYIVARNIHNNIYNLISIDDNSINAIDEYTSMFRDKESLIKNINSRGYSLDQDSDLFIIHKGNKDKILYDDILYKNEKNRKLSSTLLFSDSSKYISIYKIISDRIKKDPNFRYFIQVSKQYIMRESIHALLNKKSNSRLLESYTVARSLLVAMNNYDLLSADEKEIKNYDRSKLIRDREALSAVLTNAISNSYQDSLTDLLDHHIKITNYHRIYKKLLDNENINESDAQRKLGKLKGEEARYNKIRNNSSYILNVLLNDDYIPNEAIKSANNKYYIDFDNFDNNFTNDEINLISSSLNQNTLENVKLYKNANNSINFFGDEHWLEKDKLYYKHSIEDYLQHLSDEDTEKTNSLLNSFQKQKEFVENDKLVADYTKLLLNSYSLPSKEDFLDSIYNTDSHGFNKYGVYTVPWLNQTEIISESLNSNIKNNLLNTETLDKIKTYKILSQDNNKKDSELVDLEKDILSSMHKNLINSYNNIDFEDFKKNYYLMKENDLIKSSIKSDSIVLDEHLKDIISSEGFSSANTIFVIYKEKEVEINIPNEKKIILPYDDNLWKEMDEIFKKYENKYLKAMIVESEVLSSNLSIFSGKFPSNYQKYELVSFDNASGDIKTIPSAFSNNFFANNAIKISIPDTVEEIGSTAFKECINIPSIIIPEKVKTIGPAAFKDCRELKSVIIRGPVSKLSDDLFNGCKSLEDFQMPDSVEIIGHRAFLGCKKLSAINVENCIEIGDEAFADTGIESLILPSTVKKIGKRFLNNCNLDLLSIPEIENLTQENFSGCNVNDFSYGNDILRSTKEKVVINTTLPIEKEFYETFQQFIEGKNEYIINGIRVKSSLFNTPKGISLVDILNNLDYSENTRYEAIIKSSTEKMDKHIFFDVVEKQFDYQVLIENIKVLIDTYNLDDDAISNILADNYNLFCYSFNDAFKNFDKLAKEKIISPEELTSLYFDKPINIDNIDSMHSYLIEYQNKHNSLPMSFNSLIIDSNSTKNEVELRSRIVSISNMNISTDEKKQILMRDNFESIVSFDKKYFSDYNIPLNIADNYLYFDGIYSSIYKKIEGYDKDLFKKIFLKGFNDQGYPNAEFGDFIKNMNTFKNWDSYDNKVERATSFKNEFCARILYSCLANINKSFDEHKPHRIPFGRNDPAVDMLKQMETYNIKFEPNEISMKDIDFSNDKLVRVMLTLDPYAIEAFKTKNDSSEKYSEKYIKYIKFAEEKGYFMSEQEINDFNNYLTSHKSTIPNHEKYIINSNFGENRIDDEKRMHLFINNDISVPLISDRNKKDYLKNLRSKVNLFINNNFIENDEINLNKILSLIDVYFRSNNYYIDFLNDNKKSKLYDTIAKMYRQDSDFTDYEKIAFTMGALNKMAHSVKELEIPVDFVDKYKFSKNKNEIKDSTVQFIGAYNDVLKYGFDFKTIDDYLTIDNIKFTSELDSLPDTMPKTVTPEMQRAKYFLSMIQAKSSTHTITDNDLFIIKEKVKKIKEFKNEHRDIYDEIKIYAEENHTFFDIKKLFAEQLISTLFNSIKKTFDEQLTSTLLSELSKDTSDLSLDEKIKEAKEEGVDVSNLLLDAKKKIFEKNGCLCEIQADFAGDPTLVFFSKRFNETFSIHLKDTDVSIDPDPQICHSKLNEDYRWLFPTIADSSDTYSPNSNANLRGFLTKQQIADEIGIPVDDENVHKICRDINMTRFNQQKTDSITAAEELVEMHEDVSASIEDIHEGKSK